MGAMQTLKRFFAHLIKPTPFKIGLLVVAASVYIANIYYVSVERRRPESAEIDKRLVDRPWQERLSDLILLVHQKTIDIRFKNRGFYEPDERVMILAVDDKAVGLMGRWPWPRSRMADAIDRLMAYGAKAYGFDAVFSEPDNNQAFQSLKTLQPEAERLRNKSLSLMIDEEIKKANTDWKFAQTVQRHTDKLVMGTAFEYDEKFDDQYNPAVDKQAMGPMWQHFEHLAVPIVLDKDLRNQQNIPLTVRASSFLTNIQPIIEATTYQGYFNAVLDSDGVIRRSPLVTAFGGTFYPSLALQLAALSLDGTIALEVRNNDKLGYKVVESLSINSTETGDPIVKIPVNHKGMLSINYAGPRYMYPHMSVSELFSDKDEALIMKNDPDTGLPVEMPVKKTQFFKGKTVIFGATALGIYDLRNTPFDENYPGVETHANVLGNILTQNFHRAVPLQKLIVGKTEVWYGEREIMLVWLALFGAALAFLIGHVGAVPGAVATLVILFAGYLGDKIFLFGRGYVVTSILPIFQISAQYIIVTFYKYLTEERNKKQIKGTFEKYVSPDIVKQILADPGNLALGGEKRRMTVMFSDVRGFTTISEKMEATQLSDFLNSYLTPMTDLVFKNRGTLDKYMGDAIMAFFGAPVHYPDHAKAAAKCALDMIEKLNQLQEGWAKKGLPPIDIGIGLNTGEMSVGNMGSNTVRSYTVMGDSVNLGSRLEGINKDYGTHVIVSEFTYAEIKDAFTCREVDWVRVKGKEKPVKIYELVSEKGKEDIKGPVVEKFNEGYQFFRKNKFKQALPLFQEALALDPNDGPSLEFVERCEIYMAEPPPSDWNGVVVKKTK